MTFLLKTESKSDEGGGRSTEEEDLIGRNIKKMTSEENSTEENMAAEENLNKGSMAVLAGCNPGDLLMEDAHQQTAKKIPEQKLQAEVSKVKSQISYKAKLLGEKARDMEKNFDEQMSEWIEEEVELAPALTEEQRQALGSIPSLQLPNEKLKELCRPWRDALILTILGKNSNLHMMKDRIKWMLRSDKFELIDLPNNYFVFRSMEKSLCSKLLFDGPWLIQGHYMAVQRWSPNFNPYCNKVRKVAVWIRVPTLPLYMYSEDCMFQIGNLIGRTLKVDMNTLVHQGNNKQAVERGKYARVSVEIDLNKKLQFKFMLRNHVYPVDYEGLSDICFKCGLYGHTSDNCKMKDMSMSKTREQSDLAVSPMTVDGRDDRKLPLGSVPGVRE